MSSVFHDEELPDYSFTEYQHATRATAVYPGVGTANRDAILYTSIKLANEAGEVGGKVGKWMRDDVGYARDQMSVKRREDILDELGDVLWYCARLADELGEPLENVVMRNLDKLRDRAERGVITGDGDKR